MLRALAIALSIASPASAQDFFTLKGHGGPIMDIAVAPSGQIATASFDNAVGLWDGTNPTWLDGHAAAVNTVAFWSPHFIVSGSDDFSVRVWADTGINILLGHHKGKVVALAKCSTLIASASWDGSIQIFDIGPSMTDLFAGSKNWPHETVLTGHRGPVNDIAFTTDCQSLFSASTDGTIQVWNVDAGERAQQLVNHGFGVNELVLNEEDGWLAYGAVDGGTRLIDPDTGNEIADFTLDRRPILALAYDYYGRQLAVGDGEGFIMIIDTATRKITRDFRATKNGPIWALAFSPNGQNIHAGGIEDTLYSWPIATMDAHGQMSSDTRSFLEDPAKLSNGERQFKRKW